MEKHTDASLEDLTDDDSTSDLYISDNVGLIKKFIQDVILYCKETKGGKKDERMEKCKANLRNIIAQFGESNIISTRSTNFLDSCKRDDSGNWINDITTTRGIQELIELAKKSPSMNEGVNKRKHADLTYTDDIKDIPIFDLTYADDPVPDIPEDITAGSFLDYRLQYSLFKKECIDNGLLNYRIYNNKYRMYRKNTEDFKNSIIEQIDFLERSNSTDDETIRNARDALNNLGLLNASDPEIENFFIEKEKGLKEPKTWDDVDRWKDILNNLLAITVQPISPTPSGSQSSPIQPISPGSPAPLPPNPFSVTLLNIIQTASNTNPFFLTPEQARRRDQNDDWWLQGQWGNPVYRLERNLMELGIMPILQPMDDDLKKKIFLAGLGVISRNYIDEDEQILVYINDLIHCADQGMRRNRRVEEMIRRQRVSYQYLINQVVNQNFLVRTLNLIRISGHYICPESNASDTEFNASFISFLVSGRLDDLNVASQLMPDFMETILVMGLCVVFRWSMFLINRNIGAREISAYTFHREFWGAVDPLNIIHAQVACQVIDPLTVRRLQKYMGSVIHSSEDQSTMHFLNSSTFREYLPVIRKDVFDLAFTFFGFYSVDFSVAQPVKYHKLRSVEITREDYEAKYGEWIIPDRFISRLDFLQGTVMPRILKNHRGEFREPVWRRYEGRDTRSLIRECNGTRDYKMDERGNLYIDMGYVEGNGHDGMQLRGPRRREPVHDAGGHGGGGGGRPAGLLRSNFELLSLLDKIADRLFSLTLK